MTGRPELLARLRGGLIVSCQAYPGEPLRSAEMMSRMAEAVVRGGAVAVRAQGPEDLRLIRNRVDVPLIGLWKVGSEGVFITPTLRHALAVADAGADVVALDGTRRARPDGRTLAETVAGIRDRTDALVLADVGDLEDGSAAVAAGVDLVATTLAGYTGSRPRTDGPDLELLAGLAERLPVPVIAEGRVHSTEQARACLAAGAFAVVVGTAITHPTTITRWFADALRDEGFGDEGFDDRGFGNRGTGGAGTPGR